MEAAPEAGCHTYEELAESKLGKANGNVFQLRPAEEMTHDGVIMVRLKKKRFIVIDYMHQAGEAITELMRWIQEGELKYKVDIQEGFENIPDTLNRLFTGQNLGKQLLKIAEPN